MAQRTAVILFNLGGPDKPESIRPFLINFFMDKNIIRAPYPVRLFLSRLIANKRTKNEAGTSYGLLGGKSPLLENTKAQAEALQQSLGSEYKVFISMRYWHPMSDEVIEQVKAYNPQKIILLPLYPQYSTTTTKSSLEAWIKSAKKAGLDTLTTLVCCYPLSDGFIKASADLVKKSYHAFLTKYGFAPRLLFSAHGLPEKIIKDGDPYQWACEESAAKIAVATGIQNLDWGICYQSRVGPLKWIGPSTEEALRQAAKDKKPVLIYPHAFVSEHVETLVEIDIEYRHMAEEMGIPAFDKVPTVSIHPLFIEGLANIIRNQQNMEGFPNNATQRICPMRFSQCCQNTFADNPIFVEKPQ